MTRQILKGSINRSVELYIVDDTDGTPELGVLFDTAGIDLNYRRDLALVTSVAAVTLAALTTSHANGGFLEIANGRYRFDVPDAAFASGVAQVTIGGTITGMVVLPVTIQLVSFNSDDATRLGLTALPEAPADGIGGLPISDAGGLDLDAKLANTNEITAARMAVLTTAMARAVKGIVLGTASGTPTTTNIPTSSLVPAATVADQFKGRVITFDEDTTTAALRGQTTDITANTSGGVLTVTALTTAPVSGDTFTIQ